MKAEILPVFIGYDSREPIAYHVCVQSLMESSSLPLAITPLRLSTLKKIFHRQREANQLTDFSYTRFLVPYLCAYQGWALYIDGDMLIKEDIAQLWQLRNEQQALMVVQHPTYSGSHHFLNNSKPHFPRFNWSSVMLFNNALCTALTPAYLETVDYQELHQFKWLKEDSQLGALPDKWNHLVGYREAREDVALIHWTLGGPYLGEKFEKSDYAEEWFEMRGKAFYSEEG